jgi:ABC-type antimicrobial peptide transport system permease subunit
VFLPALQEGDAEMSLVVVTRVPPQSLATAVERELRALDPRIAIADLAPLDAIAGRVLGGYRVGAVLVGGLAALALALTAAGLYGVLAYRVTRGQRRIGVQMALGASRSSVAWAVLSRGLLLAAWGGPIGIGVAWGAGRLLDGFLFRVRAGDPWLLAGVSLFVLAVVGLASWLPAWRAARVEPVEALREG